MPKVEAQLLEHSPTIGSFVQADSIHRTRTALEFDETFIPQADNAQLVESELAKLAMSAATPTHQPIPRTLVERARAGDAAAMDQVCRRSVPLIHYLAQRYVINKKNSVPYDELIQAAWEQVPGTVQRYDHLKGSFADLFGMRALGAMLDEQRAQMPVSRGIYQELKAISDIEDPQDRRLAIHNLVAGKTTASYPVLAASGMFNDEAQLSIDPVSIEGLVYGWSEPDQDSIAYFEPTAADDVEAAVLEKIEEEEVQKLLATLPERERRAFLVRHKELAPYPVNPHEPRTIAQLGKEYGLTEGRISQLSKRASKLIRVIREND